MHTKSIARIIGFFSFGFSLILFLPILVALIYGEQEVEHFLIAIGVSAIIGQLFVLLGQGAVHELNNRDGFLIVVIFWFGLSAIASLPFMLSAHLGIVDALFEAVSAFTTTGATVISGLDDLPKSFLFYRQLLQWLGGMGMIVLAIAVLPMLGIGGMQLYRAEAPGPFKDEKLTPRLSHTARYLWVFYVGMTLANALAYWAAGMTPFDAIVHSFSTVSTGGFSTHDASLGYFQSATIESIAVLFMILGAINFSVHFIVWRKRNPLYYFQNIEVRIFLLVILSAVLIVAVILKDTGEYAGYTSSLHNGLFEVVSVITSTGFGTVDFSHWPSFLPVLLIFISFIGGCGGSTAGGMKVIRVILLTQQGFREVRQLIHPRALLPIRVGDRVIPVQTTQGVWGFFAIYVVSFVILMLLIMSTGLDQVSAFSAIATSMNNLGPGLGEVANSFATVSNSGKLIAAFAMLLGRLEVFTVLVLLTPEFWRE
ncbi:MAG: TrkH family potassium uptake protein [Gammaproteobacteria bacterium]|nr:TrkH family potassium uptake protein [Gammaproteobacteria bacterium]